MRKVFSTLLFFLIFSLFFLKFNTLTYASITINAPDSANNGEEIKVKVTFDQATWQNNDPEVRLFDPDSSKEIRCMPAGIDADYLFSTPLTSSKVSIQVIEGGKRNLSTKAFCDHPPNVNILQEKIITLKNRITEKPSCTLSRNKEYPGKGDVLEVQINNWNCSNSSYLLLTEPLVANDTNGNVLQETTKPGQCSNKTIKTTIPFRLKTIRSDTNYLEVIKGDYTLDVHINSYEGSTVASCKYNNKNDDSDIVRDVINRASSSAYPHPPPPCDPDGLEVIDIKDGNPRYKCKFIDTALRKIPTSFEGFISSLFGILLSVSGGLALVLIIISGYRIMASQGNPEKLKEAKESLTSAIIGLLFIIFSSFILRVIGVDILQIPSFIP